MKEPKDKRTKKYKEWKKMVTSDVITVPIPEYNIAHNKKNKQWQSTQQAREINVEPEPQETGLGDVLEKVLEHPAVKPVTNVIKKLIWKDGKDCNCKETKEKLNQYKLPRRFKVVRCLTYTEYKTWETFVKTRTLNVDRATIKMICTLYAGIFNRQYYEPCGNCSPKPLIHMIDKLDTVYNSYEK